MIDNGGQCVYPSAEGLEVLQILPPLFHLFRLAHLVVMLIHYFRAYVGSVGHNGFREVVSEEVRQAPPTRRVRASRMFAPTGVVVIVLLEVKTATGVVARTGELANECAKVADTGVYLRNLSGNFIDILISPADVRLFSSPFRRLAGSPYVN